MLKKWDCEVNQSWLSLVVVMSVVLSIPPALNRRLRPNGLSLRLLFEECIRIPFLFFEVLMIFIFLTLFQVCGCLQTSLLLCIVKELAGGEYVAVAVGLSYR